MVPLLNELRDARRLGRVKTMPVAFELAPPRRP